MSINQLQRVRSQEEYRLVGNYATKAEMLWRSGKANFEFWKKQKDRLMKWRGIMSTAPVLALTAAFIPVCVVEYFFSKEIYRDINRDNPWAIALGFISIGIVISEFLVYRIFPQKRDWKLYEMRHQNDLNASETDESLNHKVLSYANIMFLIGLILAVGTVGLLYKFSEARVQKEIKADLRSDGFGISDYMPVVLYLFEIITGFFVWYVIRYFSLSIEVFILQRLYSSKKQKCDNLYDLINKKLHDSEEHGFDFFKNGITPERDIRVALYRNKDKKNSEEEFFTHSEETANIVEFVIKDVEKNVIENCKIYILTEYRVISCETSDDQGKVTFKFQSYPSDMVVRFLFEYYDKHKRPVIKSGSGFYATNQGKPHIIVSDQTTSITGSGMPILGKLAYPLGQYANVRSFPRVSGVNDKTNSTFIGIVSSPNSIGKIRNAVLGKDGRIWYEVDLETTLHNSTDGQIANNTVKSGWVREDVITIK